MSVVLKYTKEIYTKLWEGGGQLNMFKWKPFPHCDTSVLKIKINGALTDFLRCPKPKWWPKTCRECEQHRMMNTIVMVSELSK